jgi:3-oxoacyl-[acyl-carrier protein] reductase
MDLGLSGLNAIVTGATKGIGRAIAESFAKEGCNVAVCARGRQDVERTCDDLRRHGVKAYPVVVDVVGDGGTYSSWVERVVQDMGGVDVVVPNIGGAKMGSDEENFRLQFELNVISAVRTVEATLPYLKESKHAAIVFIGSISALEDFGGVQAFNATKATLITYSNSLARAHGAGGIRVNIVSPGMIWIENGAWDHLKKTKPEFYKWAVKENPFGRLGRAEEVADSVVFLASPRSSFTSGANLVVDGVLTRRVQF